MKKRNLSLLEREGIKIRHKLKMLILDIITVFGALLLGIESYKAYLTFTLIPADSLALYVVVTGFASILFALSYYKSWLDERNCAVCQER